MKKQQSVSRRVIAWIGKNGAKPNAIPTLAFVSVGDFFIPALPTQTSVILLAWLQPKKAALTALAFASAAAVGACILLFLVTVLDSYLQLIVPTQDSKMYSRWVELQGYIKEYGFIALAAMSLLPTPPRLMVVLSFLSGLGVPTIISTVFIGKLVWFFSVVSVIKIAPNWLMKLPIIGKKIEKLISPKLQSD
ncbi:hypothetical protein HJP15_11085 [Pseudoalteromonas sp. NEC-BIFX-2020_002]|uniref:Alkaline phosphatase n=2 Tax=Pseudoalteromonas TaxID=53246 RepID=A0A0N1EHI3_9GAMM|nr:MULTISPECIES: hypothetical protein [Pseudoalteromonas]KPH60757.1 hypothetical protein ADS77_15725 [Pseudoalteromonas porphyrae]NMR24856.1 hypothetical protein [Pseudoalteromonas sp. NEC-BIFX-2020_015]NNG43454.1 hypothetical protein [Pseudoalteromonas sp. NEC-BIFX-2020_002]